MNEWEDETNSPDDMLKEMYELGVEHGRKLAEREAVLTQLQEDIKQLKEQINE